MYANNIQPIIMEVKRFRRRSRFACRRRAASMRSPFGGLYVLSFSRGIFERPGPDGKISDCTTGGSKEMRVVTFAGRKS